MKYLFQALFLQKMEKHCREHKIRINTMMSSKGLKETIIIKSEEKTQNSINLMYSNRDKNAVYKKLNQPSDKITVCEIKLEKGYVPD